MSVANSPENEEAIEALLQKVREALTEANVLLKGGGSADAIVNRAYYAIFSAARAALLSMDERPGTHAGVIRRFGYHFVRTGRVSEETGSILTTARSMRDQADYDVFSELEREEAAELVDEARRFVEAIETETIGGPM